MTLTYRLAARSPRGAAVLAIAAVVAGSDAGAPARAEDKPAGLLAPLAEKQGRIFAEQAGGTVVGKANDGKGKSVTLRDGDTVDFVDASGEIGDAEAAAEIVYKGQHLLIPNGRLLLEERLRRHGAWAVLSAIESCGDFCHGAAWVIGARARKRVADDVGPELIVAWRPDGKEVAVGGVGLVLVSLPGLTVVPLNDYASPVYAAEGKLYVRGPTEKDTVYEVLAGGKLRWVVGCPGGPPQPEPDEGLVEHDDPPPVQLEGDGTMVVQFKRAGGARGGACPTQRIKRADLGNRPEDRRAEAAARTAGLMLADETPPARAVELARAQAKLADRPWLRELASAANTRGYRLYQEDKGDAALPLFTVAAELDPSYGMPRFNAARVLARRGDAAGSVKWLGELKAMGPSQRARLAEARKDEAFAKIRDTPEFAALFK